jgi:Ni,Fe-hydrogenase III small subunit
MRPYKDQVYFRQVVICPFLRFFFFLGRFSPFYHLNAILRKFTHTLQNSPRSTDVVAFEKVTICNHSESLMGFTWEESPSKRVCISFRSCWCSAKYSVCFVSIGQDYFIILNHEICPCWTQTIEITLVLGNPPKKSVMWECTNNVNSKVQKGSLWWSVD